MAIVFIFLWKTQLLSMNRSHQWQRAFQGGVNYSAERKKLDLQLQLLNTHWRIFMWSVYPFVNSSFKKDAKLKKIMEIREMLLHETYFWWK